MWHFKPYDFYWIIWLGGMFLIPELLAVFKVIPLDTFSHTTSIAERDNPWLKAVVFGFGIGLVAHLILGTPLWKATLGGLIGSVAASLMLNRNV